MLRVLGEIAKLVTYLNLYGMFLMGLITNYVMYSTVTEFHRNLEFSVDSQPIVNAYAHVENGKYYVTIFQGIIDLTETDSQKALIIGHEIAHHVLGHTTQEGFYANTENSKRAEMASDTLGGYIALLSGYNPCDGIRLWAKMGQMSGRTDNTPSGPMDTHPTPYERASNFNKVFECRVPEGDLMKYE